MPNLTTNYSFYLPLVNDPTDEDLWGGYLNANWTSIDTILNTRTQNYLFADYQIQRPILKDYGELLTVQGNITGATTVDFTNSNHYSATLTGSVTFTFNNPSPTGNVMPIVLFLTQDATGSRTVTWPASVKWSGGTTPTLTTTASHMDIITLVTKDAGTTYYGNVSLDYS